MSGEGTGREGEARRTGPAGGPGGSGSGRESSVRGSSGGESGRGSGRESGRGGSGRGTSGLGASGRAPRPGVDQLVDQILDAVGAQANRDQLREIFATAMRLGAEATDRLDLKITNATMREMAEAFRVFAPYRSVPKVTMFGSARTLPVDPLYGQARHLAATLARSGWMVVTGAGPGIMAAGLEGAGREMAFGINIRLPFEQGANAFIAADPKLVEMKYFFTRKLMLMKESDGYVVLPGGFGTLDEAFELLTLLQTGKAEPAPIVLLDIPGGTYWQGWRRFVAEEVVARGLVSQEDEALYRITDDVHRAAGEILGFYRNYHSRRFVGDLLVIRLKAGPGPEELARLNRDFPDLCREGDIHVVEPLPAERGEQDHLDLPRIALALDRSRQGRLRQLVDALNSLASAPPPPVVHPE
ncbi:MAG: TIGR00730 family Rossman fold protein [Acidimicrobiales bacterium]